MTVSGSIVFDAEPLIAYLNDETGADLVEEYLDALEAGAVDGFMNIVTFTEVKYICDREMSPGTVYQFLRTLAESVTIIGAIDSWELAADAKNEFSMSIGDAYVVAARQCAIGKGRVSSDSSMPKILAGADDDFDDVPNVVRFRNDPA